MNMVWTIEFSSRAEKQLRKLDKQIVRRILGFLEKKVKNDPQSSGKCLKGQLSDFWRYRVGDYRLICRLEDSRLIVLVLEIGHRRDIYNTTDL